MSRRAANKGKTPAEKNAYARGYNAGRNRAWRSYLKAVEYAKSWREKVREGMSGARCDACMLWDRGEDGKRKWGYCRQSDDWECSPDLGRAWAEADDYKTKARLITHENFECINFKRLVP